MRRFFTFALILLIGCGQGSSKDNSSPKQVHREDAGETGSPSPINDGRGSPEKRDTPIDFTLSDITPRWKCGTGSLDSSGQVYTLSKQKGKVVLLDFWATWCPSCRAKIPGLIALYNKYESQGFVILGIGLDKEKTLKEFTEEKKIVYPVLVGNKKIAKDYKIQGIPATYIIDKEGKIAFHHVGFAPGMEKTLEQEIITLLNENL